MDRDADDSERKQQQPDKRIRDQRQQSQRPAHYEQDAPQEESEHVETSLVDPSIELYGDGRQKVPRVGCEVPYKV
jgi:hypothetical protein